MTVEYLSDAWHARFLELADSFPTRPGVSARLAVVVTGSPTGDIRYFQIISDGRIVRQGLGELTDADVVLTSTFADSAAMLRGELDANVAFMQGRMKMAGSTGPLLAVLPLTLSPEYRALQATLQAETAL
jgi:hypothetical protein